MDKDVLIERLVSIKNSMVSGHEPVSTLNLLIRELKEESVEHPATDITLSLQQSLQPGNDIMSPTTKLRWWKTLTTGEKFLQQCLLTIKEKSIGIVYHQ